MNTEYKQMLKQILILYAYGFNIAFPEYVQYYLCGWMIYSLIRDTDKDGKFMPSDGICSPTC